jgi:hypothetical protein
VAYELVFRRGQHHIYVKGLAVKIATFAPGIGEPDMEAIVNGANALRSNAGSESVTTNAAPAALDGPVLAGGPLLKGLRPGDVAGAAPADKSQCGKPILTDCPTCDGDGRLTDQPGTFKDCPTCAGCGVVMPASWRIFRGYEQACGALGRDGVKVNSVSFIYYQRDHSIIAMPLAESTASDVASAELHRVDEPTTEQRQAINDLLVHMRDKMARGEEINWLAMPHEIWRALREGASYSPSVTRSAIGESKDG